MEQELKTIYEAQKLDTQILDYERKTASTPRRIGEMKQEMAEMTEKVAREKEIIEELEKERRKKEKDLDMEKEKIRKLEAKLYEVKTNKEYQALLKEIETIKNANDTLEEDIITLMEKVEDFRKDLQAASTHMTKRESEIEKTVKELEKESRTVDKDVTGLKTARDNLLSVVSEDLRKAYETLREKRGGTAVVNVRDGVCLGCYMNIPPQLFIEVTKNRQLIACPSCNRIFYFSEEE